MKFGKLGVFIKEKYRFNNLPCTEKKHLLFKMKMYIYNVVRTTIKTPTHVKMYSVWSHRES